MPSANQPINSSSNVVRNPPTDANGNQGGSSLGDSVELSLADFKLNGSTSRDQEFATKLVACFDSVKRKMNRPLAEELAKFLPVAWGESRLNRVGFPAQHKFYISLRRGSTGSKDLYYPHWFYMAIRWGPDHPTLAPLRKDMSTLWNFEFPKYSVIFPGNIPTWRQKLLFHGKRADSTPLSEMEDRIQGFKAAIEGTDKPSIIEAVAEYAPGLLNKAVHNDGVESLDKKLEDTQKQLQKTREELTEAQGQLKKTGEQLKATQDQLQKTEQKCNVLEKNAENSNKDLAATNRRVDKAMETCALVLSILTAPGGEKRKAKSEQDEA